MADVPNMMAHPSADWSSGPVLTGAMRWYRRNPKSKPVLQQEWMLIWGNELGEDNVKEWHDVPTEDCVATEVKG